MEIVYESRTGERELDLRVSHPGATVEDLVRALGGERAATARGVMVAGKFVDRGVPLAQAGLFEGARIRVANDGQRDGSQPASGLELTQIAGLRSGRSFPLAAGEVTVGRDPSCDVVLNDESVSRQHCKLSVSGTSVTVADVASRNGTFVDGARVGGAARVGPDNVLQVGNVHLVVRPRRADDRPLAVDPGQNASPDGTVPFNRPPRSAPDPEPAPLTVPSPPGSASKPPFSVASIVAPLLFGGVMVVALGNILFALLALLSPVMVIGNWYEARFRSSRSLRGETREYNAAVERMRSQVAERHHAAISRERVLLPDLAEVRRRAELPSVRMWERRKPDGDFLLVSAGLGHLPWQPVLRDQSADPPPEVADVLAQHAVLPMVPVPVDLSGGGVVGIVGDRRAVLALARALVCQVATHQGPADVGIAILTDESRVEEWEWAKWLPHTRDLEAMGDARLLGATYDEACGLLEELLSGKGTRAGGQTTLAVIDDESLTAGRQAPARRLLERPEPRENSATAGIVVASSEDRLPALCDTVISVREDGAASLRRPQTGERIERFIAAGLSASVAREHARVLARFDDPDVQVAGAGLPEQVTLSSLLGAEALDAEVLRRRWRETVGDGGAAAAIGVGDKGPFVVDLVRQGPHALIGGTTGSGKSELLRTLVAALAVTVDPTRLTFVLIDFKGGSTFDECAELPHTVGLATDLDEQLAERALRCLRAELRYRERRFREAEANDLVEYIAKHEQATPGSPAAESLPRLVVIIDEFAEMAVALPDFIDALVGIGRRGRSLGVHMILATQKPAGVVNDDIRSNTDLKIALRVQDEADSIDVIGVRDAASISKSLGGRAFVRVGPADVVAIQTALASAETVAESGARLDLAPFRFGRVARIHRDTSSDGEVEPRGETDLSRLVGAVTEAFRKEGRPLPRRPWTDPLPARIDLDRLLPLEGRERESGPKAPFALADDPDEQTQYPWGWQLPGGNLLLYGNIGSGTTTALASLALAHARTYSPDQLHVYVLDFGAGDLSALVELPHVGAAIGSAERERHVRFVRHLSDELARRKGLGGELLDSEPTIVLLLDNFAGFTAAFDDVGGRELLDAFARLYAEGPGVGIHIAMSAERAGSVPAPLAALTHQKLVFRLPDTYDYGAFGIARRQVPSFVPGRALVAADAQVVQIAWPGDMVQAVASTAAMWPQPERTPAPIGVLPGDVAIADIAGAAQLGGSPWRIPIGIGDRTLAPVGFELYEGDNVVVTGPPRSGRSTVLATLAWTVKRAAPDVAIVAVALRQSPLRDSPDVDRWATTRSEAAESLRAVAEDVRPHLVLLDDAEALDDPEGAIAALLALDRPDVHVVIAGRPDALRGLYGHWTQKVRQSKLGLLLRPVDMDGDLLGASLPRRQQVPASQGRGYLVNNGVVELVQAARVSTG